MLFGMHVLFGSCTPIAAIIIWDWEGDGGGGDGRVCTVDQVFIVAQEQVLLSHFFSVGLAKHVGESTLLE